MIQVAHLQVQARALHSLVLQHLYVHMTHKHHHICAESDGAGDAVRRRRPQLRSGSHLAMAANPQHFTSHGAAADDHGAAAKLHPAAGH
jgi:hypothetical protein